MPTRRYKPKTNGFRLRQVSDFAEITTDKPVKALTKRVKRSAGRNHTGQITVRHRGGGAKKKYREIDFKRRKDGIAGKVVSIEYDPNRTAYIACISYVDGDKRYIIAPRKIAIGTVIMSGPNAEISTGNALPLANIPTGSLIHNIELSIGGGAKLVRSAGTSATLLAKNDGYATIKMPSGEMRMVLLQCVATMGQVSNVDERNKKKGKAGASRWKGIRPTVRGSVMNPNDHPHGGGEGKAPIGMSSPKSYTGKRTRRKTRKKPNRFVVSN